MERCPTCGAAVRPGAKFCTSCGSRLEEKAPEPTADAQETIVATPAVSQDDVTPEPNWEAASGGTVEDVTGDNTSEPIATDDDTPAKVEASGDEDTSWSARWPEPRTTESEQDSPADRLRSALDAGENDSDALHATWAWDASGEPVTSDWSNDTEEVATESETITPAPTTTSERDDAGDDEPTIPTTGEDDATMLAASDQEVSASTTENEPGHDPLQHANELLNELRGLIWQIGGSGQAANTQDDVIQNISRVRGETDEFADLTSVIAAVRDNPRDIDALRDLSQKADRLQALLDSHTRLVSTLEEALQDN